jgi:hypothetical protein
LKPEDIKDITPRHLPLFLDNKDSDTVKRINLDGGDEPLFVISIVEHESQVNYTSSYKMLLYIALVWHTYVKDNDKKYKQELKRYGSTKRKLSTDVDFKLPPVLPVVFYDGGTQWTSAMNLLDRVHMGDIFEKYIPKFEYELVDLSQYSQEDIIKYGNALSLILLIDKIRQADDIDFSVSVPEDYLEKLSQNIPDSLLPLISDCVKVFLKHIEAPEAEIDRIADKIYQRRLNEMFQMVDGYSVKKTREQARIDARIEVTAEVTAEVTKEVTEEMINKMTKEKTERNRKLVGKMIKRGDTIAEIADFLEITIEEVEDLK